MRDLSFIMDTAWLVVTTLMYVNGALGVVLLIKQTKVDIALIIFVTFEWISSLISTISFITFFTTLNKNLLFALRVLSAFCVTASTTLGIYWIDNLILEGVKTHSLYLRQLKISFITLFIVSVLFKFLVIIRLFPQNVIHQYSNEDIYIQSDPEMATMEKESSKFGSTLSDSIGSSKVNAIKIKGSSQTLVSKQSTSNKSDTISNITTKSQEGRLKEGDKEKLELKYAEIFKMPSRTDTIDTTDLSNSTPNMIFEQKPLTSDFFRQPQILEQNCHDKKLPSTMMMPNLSTHITEEDHEDSGDTVFMKHPDYQFPRNGILTSPYKFHYPNYNFILEQQDQNNDNYEDKHIQALNISEPIYENNLAEKITTNGKTFHNISLQTWNEKSKNFLENSELANDRIPLTNSHLKHFGSSAQFTSNSNEENNILDIQSFSSESNNGLYEELNREIKENGSHRNQIQMQQSLPNLKLPSRHNSRLNRGGSVSKIMGMNSSGLKNKSSTNLMFVHQKSNSLSAMPMSKSHSHSPLKKFKDFKDSLQLTPHTPKQTRSSSPVTTNEFELDLNIANSIRKSPVKKLSSRSLSSKISNKKISLASPNRNNPNVSMFELGSYNPAGFGCDLNLHVGDADGILDVNAAEGSPSDKKSHFTHIVDDYIVQNIIKSQRVFSGVSGISGTDKSTTSNNSVPSGYYGEYDKEKWRVFKKVAKNGVRNDTRGTLDLSSHILNTP